MTLPKSLEAELLRDVLSTTAHDLGGLASALSLRADVIERAAASEGGTALRRIANELRTLGQDVRAFRSHEGGDSLSPTRPGSLAQWLARVLRYGKPILPRGSSLDGRTPEATVESAAALDLTYITLAVMQQIASGWPDQRVMARVDVEVQDSSALVTINAFAESVRLQLPGDESAAWWQWALARGDGSTIALRIDDGCVRLAVPLLTRA